MSLVVGAIAGSQAALVADTKITFGIRDGVVDPSARPPNTNYSSVEAANRDVYQNSLPKIVLLGRSIAVGYAGEDPVRQLRRLVALRGKSVEDVLENLSTVDSGADFVVLADDDPLRLWQIRDQHLEDRASIGKAWAGDRDAFESFQQEWNRWPKPMDVEFLASSSIQFPISFGVVDSVGGFLTQVRRSHKGLHFVPHPVAIAPHHMQLISSEFRGSTLKLNYVVPHGVDPTATFISTFAGAGATVGASAHLILPAEWGLLFTHESPWDPVVLRARSVREFETIALEKYQQELHGAENPYF